MAKLPLPFGHRRRANTTPSLSAPGPVQVLAAAAMTAVPPAQPAAARSPLDLQRADDDCSPDTRRQIRSDEAEKNALWDEAYDTMKSKTGSLAKKFEEVVMEEYYKMAKGQSLRDASLRGLAAFPEDTETKRRLMLEITRLQLILDIPAQTARGVVQTATKLLEMLRAQLLPLLELYPPAGLAFGGLCLVLRMVGFAMTSQEEMMKGLSHIAYAFEWYLELSISSVLQHETGKREDAPTPHLRHLLVNLLSTMLEYQARSVVSSRHWHIISLLFRPSEFSDLLTGLKKEEEYVDGKVGLSIQTRLLRLRQSESDRQEQTKSRFITKQFCSTEPKRVSSEEDNNIAKAFSEWLHDQPAFKSWVKSSRGILAVTSTRRTNPALAKTIASTLAHGGDEKALIAHFASTDTKSKHQFPKLAMELTHQLLCRRQALAFGPVSNVEKYKCIERNDELLFQSVVQVLKGLERDTRVIFVLDLSRGLMVDDREGFQQLMRKMFCTNGETTPLIKLLITSHMDTGVSKLLSGFGDITTYLRVPPGGTITKGPSLASATSSPGAGATQFTGTVLSTTKSPLESFTERNVKEAAVSWPARGIDIELLQSVLFMISGACRPLTLAELASSVAAYRAVTEGLNVMELIGSEELEELLLVAGCTKYVSVSLQQVCFKTKTAAHEAAKVYGLGGVMPMHRAKLALAEASTFYLSQQVAGLMLDEVDELAKDVAIDLEYGTKTSKSGCHCSAIEDSITNASFMCYAAEHSAPQLAEFPIYDARDGSLCLRPFLQESQRLLWQPYHFCMRFWYHRLNASDTPVHDSHVAYLCYSRAYGPASKKFGSNFFIAAAELGLPALVTEGRRRNQNANETNQFGHSALHIAAMHKDVAMSRTLLEDVGVDILAKDALGFTPFHLAADLGNPQLLEFFFEAALRRLNANQILEFRSMFDSGSESRRRDPLCECGYDQLIERFVLSSEETALSDWEAWSMATCKVTMSAREIGKGMIYLACRRNPRLMRPFLDLGINAAELRER